MLGRAELELTSNLLNPCAFRKQSGRLSEPLLHYPHVRRLSKVRFNVAPQLALAYPARGGEHRDLKSCPRAPFIPVRNPVQSAIHPSYAQMPASEPAYTPAV